VKLGKEEGENRKEAGEPMEKKTDGKGVSVIFIFWAGFTPS